MELNLDNPLVNLYVRLVGWVMAGFILGKFLPKSITGHLGKFLFFIGAPFSTVAFMRRTTLSGYMAIAPISAWTALLVGAGLAWIWIDLGLSDERLKQISRGISVNRKTEGSSELDNPDNPSSWSKPTQGSFLLAMMVGNTGFLGIPVILTLIGTEYFAWGLFYDLSISLGVQIFGVALAAYYGTAQRMKGWVAPLLTVIKNPSLWAFLVGALIRPLELPNQVDDIFRNGAWLVINLFLILIGLQLSRLTSLKNLKQGLTCLSIKMLLTPLVVGTGLMFFGVTGPPRLLLVLLMGMPPAFVTTLYAERYGLDRDLAITTVALGSVLILFTIPLWMWLFGF
ncbi:MAG: AEC family transporter [Pseudanabaenaceae cyanobacterium bins.39]|nr:AEC family transporter [Pseudanabaenaceae cyanobacterium bins.39]